MFFISQGEKQILDILNFVFDETTPKSGGRTGKKTGTAPPWREKNDIAPEKIDNNIVCTPNSAPTLYLFFAKGAFDLAEVSADNCVIHLQAADVIKALVTYVAVYFVFHVGYAAPHMQFLGFMQYALLGAPYQAKKSIGHIALLHRFDVAMEQKKSGRQFKKLCVA